MASGRFIPAGAGNTTASRRRPRTATVHPRWRGEHNRGASVEEYDRGSSPLARGTHHRNDGATGQRRFIPAGAGNTGICGLLAKKTTVHPRWRGEHEAKVDVFRFKGGSSPLARGTQPVKHRWRCSRRFIPAGAGNTHPRRCSLRSWSVHPRWRGEHFSVCLDQHAAVGSSPLARGTHSYAPSLPSSPRFIPAGAGNTITGALVLISRPVHPRWRGEHYA